MNFTDAQFLTKKEKELTYKQWVSFINWLADSERSKETIGSDYGGEIDPKGYRLFTDRVYKHLSLHCGFIAHYNRAGFFGTYFNSGIDTETFFNNLINNGGYGDTQDLTQAMIAYHQTKKDRIAGNVLSEVDDKVALLEECVKRAKTDPEFAKEFLRSL
ncbi:MAG: hypothetical protein Q8O75_01155 [bacterium]|nr:hypothetical protein [bacterium]